MHRVHWVLNLRSDTVSDGSTPGLVQTSCYGGKSWKIVWETIYVKQILNASGFKNIKVDKIYTSISTYDDSKKDGELLFNIGLAGRLLAEENLSEEELSKIKNKIIEMAQKRQIDGKINYKACLNFVSATK